MRARASSGSTPRSESESSTFSRAEEGHEPDGLADEREARAAQLGAAGAVERGQRDAVEHDLPRIGEVEPGEQVEERCLPGARGPGDRVEPPADEGRRHVVERLRPAEASRQAARLEQSLCSLHTKWGANGLVARVGRSLCSMNTSFVACRGGEEKAVVLEPNGCAVGDPR